MAAKDEEFLPTRRSLLVRIKNPDDRASWQEFYNTYSKFIRGVAMKAGLSECEAQEVLQETMISLSKKIAEFEYDPAKGKFKGWLRKLTCWRINDQFRKRQPQIYKSGAASSKTTRTSTIARIADPKGCELEAIWEEEWMKNLFERAVERVKRSVNAKQYQIFDLYVIKKWPAEKVAAMLGITTGQVFLAKHRVMKVIKPEISRLEDETGF
jgi:RNA polymerase sigma factor (sigma-70 family)